MPGVQLALGRETEKRGRAVTFRGTRVLIGRTERCSIRLGEGVSDGEHAALVFDADVWSIRDLGSADGTYVNGVRVSSATIVAGDMLGIGESGAEMQVLEVDPPSERTHVVPVHEVVSPPPPATLVAPVRRVPAWPGVVVLLAVIAGLAWRGTQGGGEAYRVARAATPHELFLLYRDAVRDRQYHIQYDLYDDESRTQLAELNGASPGPDFREALALRGPDDWNWIEPGGEVDRFEWARADLDPDGRSGTLVVLEPEGGDQGWGAVFEKGSWRLSLFHQWKTLPR